MEHIECKRQQQKSVEIEKHRTKKSMMIKQAFVFRFVNRPEWMDNAVPIDDWILCIYLEIQQEFQYRT